MELDAAHAAVARADRGVWRIVAVRDRRKFRGDAFEAVAMRHPHLLVVALEALEERIAIIDHERRGAVFACLCTGAVRAEMLRNHIHTVTNSEDRAAQVQ